MFNFNIVIGEKNLGEGGEVETFFVLSGSIPGLLCNLLLLLSAMNHSGTKDLCTEEERNRRRRRRR